MTDEPAARQPRPDPRRPGARVLAETAIRAELEAKLAEAEERSRRLEAVGREMLACFSEESGCGLPELRTPWVPAGRIERWRVIVHQRNGKRGPGTDAPP